MNKQLISIVIPAFNEQLNIPIIYRDLIKIWRQLSHKYSYEIIFVDDGSMDYSWQKIDEIAKKDKNVKGISFSKNFGHQNAMQAGLKISNGDAVITIDCDLQHPVELIPDLVKAWEKGSDIVNTKRYLTKNEPSFKKITSSMFYKLINILSETKIEPG